MRKNLHLSWSVTQDTVTNGPSSLTQGRSVLGSLDLDPCRLFHRPS